MSPALAGRFFNTSPTDCITFRIKFERINIFIIEKVVFQEHITGLGAAVGFQEERTGQGYCEHPMLHRTDPTAKNDLAPSASRAEKP